MVEYLGQDDTPLQFQGESLKDKKADDFFLKYGTIPEPRSTENVEFKIIQTIIKIQL